MLSLLCLVGCRPRADEVSAVRVANGVETSTRPEVVLLFNAESGALCTGTFFAPRLVLTAAHCFTAKNAGDLRLEDDAPVTAFHAGIVGDPAAVRVDDVAVLAFERPIAVVPAELGTAAPVAGDEVEMIGFGRLDSADGTTSGEKRLGKNRVAAALGGFIVVDGVASPNAATVPGEDAVGARGDSGGPLFFQGRIVGVDSGGGSKTPGRKRTQYVSVVGEKARGVICAALASPYADGVTWPWCS